MIQTKSKKAPASVPKIVFGGLVLGSMAALGIGYLMAPKLSDVESSNRPPGADFSKPANIPDVCVTKSCQNTAAEVHAAFNLWHQTAKELGWSVPDFMHDPNFIIRRVAVESNMGGAGNRKGSDYFGILQFSLNKGDYFRDNVAKLIPLMKKVKLQIPALLEAEKQLIKENIEAASEELKAAEAVLKKLQKELNALSNTKTQKKGNKKTKTSPTKKPTPQNPNIRELEDKIKEQQLFVGTVKRKLDRAKSCKSLPVNETMLMRAAKDNTAQVLFDLTLAFHQHNNLVENKPNYSLLSSSDQAAILYFSHNSMRMALTLTDTLAPEKDDRGFVKRAVHSLFRKVGLNIFSRKGESQKSIDELTRAYKESGYGYIFQNNSGLYHAQGYATPREVISRYYALTDGHVRSYDKANTSVAMAP